MKRKLTRTSIASAAAFAAILPTSAFAQRVWDGGTSGVWTDATNWDGDTTTPSSGNALQFGAATNYTITNSPSTTFGNVTFTSAAGANYTLSGNGTNNEIYGTVTVQGSASATNHTINNRFRLNNKAFDVQSASTSLTLTNFDYGGSSRTLTKNGVGTLILTTNATNPGVLQLNAGTIDYQNNVGTGNGIYKIGGTSSSSVVTNSTGTNRTLQFGYDSGSTASFAGSITGNLSLANGRTGNSSGVNQTFTSTSASTYTGSTTVNSGSFTVNGTHTGGDDYSINSRTNAAGNGTLGGAGTIVLADNTKMFSFTGNASDRMAVLRPGADGTDTTAMTLGSVGVNTTVNLNNFSILRLDIAAAMAADSLNVFGSLNLDAGSSLDLVSLAGAFDGSTYTIANYNNSGLTGTFGTVTVDGTDTLASKGYQLNYGSTAITLSAIPEPSASLLLGGAGMLLMLRRRRA